MTNLDVAKAILFNAICYGEAGDLETVMVNLRLIEKLLEHPHDYNYDYNENDFK